jgi:Fanconi anemia group J protein
MKELVKVLEQQQICAYCYTRANINQVDILLLPYNYVLSESIRNSIKLKLNNKIIIFDEAHNIEDAAESASSVTLTVNELNDVLKHIDNQNSSKSTYNIIMNKNPISKTIY